VRMRQLRKTLTALALATVLLWIASTAGCGSGWRRTTDPPPDGVVLYVARGYLAPPGIESTLRIQDPDERLKEFSERTEPIEDRFIVPSPTFLWLMKQTAEARRLRTRGPG